MIGKVGAHAGHGAEHLDARLSAGVEHACPEVDADGIVATHARSSIRAWMGGRGIEAVSGNIVDPVHGESMARTLLQEAGNAQGNFVPWTRGVKNRQPLEEEQGHVAGIDGPGAVMLKADGAGHEHGPEAGQVRDFGSCDPGQHLAADVGVDGMVPQAAGLEQRVGHPDIGVGGGVGVQHFPLAVGASAP